MKMVRIVSIVAVAAMMLSAAQTERVTDAPAWFFKPPAGEYAGVSMPFENSELARQHAVYAALLSYVAQNDTEVDCRSSIRLFDSGDEHQKTERASACHFTMPGNYRIVETAINRYGELFVLLQIMPGSDSIRVFAKEYLLNSVQYGFETQIYQLTYSIEDASQPHAMTHIFGKSFTQNDTISIEVEVEHTKQRSSAKETFVPEQKYSYRPTASRPVKTTNYGILFVPEWSYHSVRYSLGAAYTTALLRGIMQDSTTESAKIQTTVIGTSNNDATVATSEVISQNRIIKPARVITAGINTNEQFTFSEN